MNTTYAGITERIDMQVPGLVTATTTPTLYVNGSSSAVTITVDTSVAYKIILTHAVSSGYASGTTLDYVGGTATVNGTVLPIVVGRRYVDATTASRSTFDPATTGVNLTKIIGTALTETTSGWIAAAFKKLFNVATPKLTAANGIPDNFETVVINSGQSISAFDAETDPVNAVVTGIYTGGGNPLSGLSLLGNNIGPDGSVKVSAGRLSVVNNVAIVSYLAGKQVDIIIRNDAGQVWQTTTTSLVAEVLANRGNYLLNLADDLSRGIYTATIDPPMPAGAYYITAYDRAGLSETDPTGQIASALIEWTGTAVVTLASRSDFQFADYTAPPTPAEIIAALNADTTSPGLRTDAATAAAQATAVNGRLPASPAAVGDVQPGQIDQELNDGEWSVA